MKKMIILIGILVIAASVMALVFTLSNEMATNGGEKFQNQKAEGRKAIAELGKTLKETLQSTMKESGPLAAIQVCNLQAMPLTAETSAKTGFEIKRTSLKLRNPANAPTAWEQKTLQQFEKESKHGVTAGHLEYAVIAREDGEKVFKMMAAIPTGKPCLVCHGENIAPAIAAKLKEHYPKDLATGFKEGDLRGAFSLRLVL